MVKEQQDFTVFSKNKVVLSCSVVDERNLPIDLTPYPQIYWFMMNRPHSDTYMISKSVGNGIVKTDAENGVFTITLNSSDLAGKTGSFYHEAVLVDVDNNAYTIMVGTAKVRKSAYDR